MYRTVRPGNASLGRTNATDDSYLNKLVKYVPVDAGALHSHCHARQGRLEAGGHVRSSPRDWATPPIAVQAKADSEKPRIWFWPFVVVAFCAWTVGASEEFRSLLSVSSSTGGWLLAIVAAALPAADAALEKLFPA